jgi:chromosome segregation protein
MSAPAGVGEGDGRAGDDEEGAALATWEARATELRERRDRLVEQLATQDADRRAAEHGRARAETAATLAEERVARTDRDAAALTEREGALQSERDGIRAELATATEAEAAARAALASLHAADAADRARLADAERAAAAAREHLRAADERLRAVDRVELEARLRLESLREGVLVELAGLGELGLASLGVAVAVHEEADDSVADDTAALEAALSAAAERWAAEPPPGPPPAPGRLAQLRRRYHELGAANPFAVEEYAELKTRLETLETQGADMRTAIAKTRSLIAELDTMIADQFRTTFAALEAAFERRFEQLFGGGFARLSLTDPSDLGSTGVEIVARPPGKKAQALAMLSGGERALTAVALLFAMLEVRPVPFCVLDEVDAALDEANIGRFAEVLRGLADRTQFIVITHNRGTIEMADALYGVTVGDDSVSRVISLRLDEAQELASERRRELGVAG